MHDALQHNAQLWILIADAVTADDSPLDPARRADVAKLAAWVVDRTLACMATRDPSIAEHLCGLNTTLARGLDGMPATEDEMKAAEAAVAARTAADRAAAAAQAGHVSA